LFCPFKATLLDRKGKVGELDSEEATYFAQVFDRLSRRSRAEFGVWGVDIRSLSNQKLNDKAAPTQRCVVKGHRS
jgi:hypothetical protein